MKKKVVLAYSGGLDTSVIIKWLAQRDYEIIAYCADVGQGDDFDLVKKKAIKTGAKKVYVGNLQKEFVEDVCFKALKANALYEDKYPLATAMTRPIIAKGMVEVAHKEGAKYIAHGCTGKGNDQVRLEVTARCLDSKLDIIAPVREWELTTRESEIDYAKKHGIPVEVTKKKIYSIDRSLWGISIEGGKLEDPQVEPPQDIYQMTKSIDKTPNKPEYIEIAFDKGIPVAIGGKKYSPIELVKKLHKIGGDHGIGRIDMIEDRLVGIKSREIYEAPAATILIEAHKALEYLTLDRASLKFKAQVAIDYARLIYDGLWYTPLKHALDAFIDKTQEKVTGIVRVKLYKGHAIVVGRKSENSLYKEELATYSEGDKFDQSLSKGFIELFGLPYRDSMKNEKRKK